jgi:hypothetical protein
MIREANLQEKIDQANKNPHKKPFIIQELKREIMQALERKDLAETRIIEQYQSTLEELGILFPKEEAKSTEKISDLQQMPAQNPSGTYLCKPEAEGMRHNILLLLMSEGEDRDANIALAKEMMQG